MSKKIFASNDNNAFAIIDDDVFETILEMGIKFCIDNKGYFYSTTKIQLQGMEKKKCLLLHRFVFTLKTGTEPSSEVDHADIDKLNNQFSNLRLASRQQQQQHRGKLRTNTSGYIGVCHYHKVNKHYKNGYRNYWRACIQRQDGKNETKFFPYTENGKQHAAMWRDTKARKYYGEFHGQLNFPMPTY